MIPLREICLTTNLRREGYRTVQARGGDEALELALNCGRRDHARRFNAEDGWLGRPRKRSKPILNFATSRNNVTVAPDRGIGLSLGAAEVMTKPLIARN